MVDGRGEAVDELDASEEQADASDSAVHLAKLDRRDPVSTEVARKLLGYLFSGHLEVGTRLPSERVLSEQFGVSRSAIREALRPLALLGVVEVRPGSGTFVNASSSNLLPEVVEWGVLLGEQSLRDLVEARRFVESALAQLAADRRDEDTIVNLQRIVAEMSAAQTVDEFVAADLAFHLCIADAAENEVLAGVLGNIRSLLKVWMTRLLETRSVWKRIRSEHQAVLAAIIQRDSDAAGAAMESHLRTVTEELRKSLEMEPGSLD